MNPYSAEHPVHVAAKVKEITLMTRVSCDFT